jgi:phage host-nuclease inhibitor protein Gam
MAAKKKVDAAPVYTDWAEVDDALRQIRELDAKVGKAEAEANKLRARADEACAAVADDLKLKKQLEKNMAEFCTARLPELLPAKSKKLNHGTIQFNSSKECVVKQGFTITAALGVMLAPLQEPLNRLVEKLRKRYVRVKTEIDKASALTDYNAGTIKNEKLGELGLEVVEKDNFGYTLADKPAQA